MTSAKSQDKPGLQALKLATKPSLSGNDRDKVKKLIDNCRRDIKEPQVGEAISTLGEYFLTRARMAEIGQPLASPTAAILMIGRYGMVKAAEVASAQIGDSFGDVPLRELLAIASSVRFIEVAGKKHKDLKAQIIALLTERPEVADNSALLDWLAQRAKPKELGRLAPLLLASRQRLPHLATHAQVLHGALLRDKGGELLRECLAAAADKPEWLDRVRVAIVGDAKLLTLFLAALPKLLIKPEGAAAVAFVESRLPEFPKTARAMRESVAGALAGLAAKLLQQPKRSELANRLLERMSNSTSQWITMMETAEDFANFWLVARAAVVAEASKAQMKISPDGARLLTGALEKARGGYSGEALLEALALNLGMEPVGEKGDAVVFDTAKHEDAVGGLLSGDAAIVAASGWRLGEQIVRRSKVTPKQT